MDNIIFHIDVNSAFLSWSAVKHLAGGAEVDLREIPSIIGGDRQSRHGIVLAKSIPAKKYGIYTAQPIVDALRLCPNLLVVPPEHNYYKEQSEKFVSILREYTSDIEQVSIDECYMDFTGIRNQFESPIEAALIIKNRIKDELKFTVNVGISDRKVLAKMASDFEKPDKIHTLYHDEIKQKMWNLDIGDLFMAGKSTVSVMRKLGIDTIGQLANTPVDIIESHLKSHGRMLWQFANGIDDSTVSTVREDVKGIGNSTTLAKDVTDIDTANKVLLELSDKVAVRIRNGHFKAQVVCVEIKYSNFTKASKQMTVDRPVSTGNEICNYARKLYKELWNGEPVRLIGIRTTKLVAEDEPEQISLFDIDTDTSEKQKKLEAALDDIRKKYGKNSVMRASSYAKGKDES